MHSPPPTAQDCFDIVGDVHGCLEELLALMALLGYRVEPTPAGKRLLRLTSHGDGYRVADDEEEMLFEAAPTELWRPGATRAQQRP